MGIAYVLMILFVINFAIYTGGRQLPGTFPLFLIPVLTALSVIIVRRMRTGEALPGGMAGAALMLIACAGGIVLGLALGVPALLAALRPYVREERYAKLDKAIQIAKLSRLIRSGLDLFRARKEDGHV